MTIKKSVLAARDCGIKGIHLKNRDYAHVRERLVRLGILPEI